MSDIPTITKAFAYPPNGEQGDEVGVKTLRPIEVATPKPGPGEVLVKIKAVSLNYRDVMIGNNVYPGPYSNTEGKGAIPVSDASGEIVQVGPDEHTWKVGDRVMTSFTRDWLYGPAKPEYSTNGLGGSIPGALTQYYLARSTQLLSAPRTLSFVEASTISCAGVTAFHSLFENTLVPLAPDHTVLVQGTGGVSLWAAQIALASGARVIATTSSKEKEDKLRALGVRNVINYRETPQWGAEVKKLTGGVGAQHIIDVGGSDTLHESIQAVAFNGTINLIGGRSGAVDEDAAKMLTMDIPFAVIFVNATIRGVFTGSRDMTARLNSIIERHNIKPVVDQVFQFSESVEAFEWIESGKQFGKIVIQVD